MPNSSYTILVIEDEEPLMRAITRRLSVHGCKTIEARSVAEARKILAKRKRIHAVWMDHYLFGVETGLDLVHDLKKRNSPWKTLPLFLVSNTAGEDKVMQYLHAGVNKYFIKSDNKLDHIIHHIKQNLVIA